MTLDTTFYAEIVFLILLPPAFGIPVSQRAGTRAKRRGASPLWVRSLHILITVIWLGIAVYGVTLAFGPFSFLSALTISAIATIALTLALQTTLQNIIAGFLLLRQGFLRIGDDVQMGGVRGKVVSIGLVTVVLKLSDGALAVVSNSNMLSGPTINYTAQKRLAGEY